MPAGSTLAPIFLGFRSRLILPTQNILFAPSIRNSTQPSNQVPPSC